MQLVPKRYLNTEFSAIILCRECTGADSNVPGTENDRAPKMYPTENVPGTENIHGTENVT